MKYNYVYRITNKENNKHYYGVRSSKIEPKLDLGIKYFSSSSDEEFMLDQKINKDNFRYKVIKMFETREEAINLEIKLHNKFDVAKNSNFYNKSKQLISSFDTSGLKLKTIVCVKDDNKYTVNSEEFFKENHISIFKDLVSCLDENNNFLRVSRTEFNTNKKLLGLGNNKVICRDVNGTKYIVTKDEFKNKNHVHCLKGVNCKNETKLKISKTLKYKNVYLLYNENDELFKTFNDGISEIKEFCKLNKFPFDMTMKSIRNNVLFYNELLPENIKSRLITLDYFKFKNWRCVKEKRF